MLRRSLRLGEWRVTVDLTRLIPVLVILIALPIFGILYTKEQQARHQTLTARVVAVGATVAPTATPSQPISPSPTPTPSPSTPTPSPSPTPTLKPFEPTRFAIESAGVNAKVIGKPTVTAWNNWLGKEVSSFGVPAKGDIDPVTGEELNPLETVVWWSSGPMIGASSKVENIPVYPILLGHTSGSADGVFNKLGDLKAGDKAIISGASPDQVAHLVVLKVSPPVDKSDPSALQQALQSAPEGTVAAAITCSGLSQTFQDGSVSHEKNTVVFFAQATP